MAVDPDYVAASQSGEEEDSGFAVPIESALVLGPEDGTPLPADPTPYMRTTELPANGTIVMIEGQRKFRRQITIIQFAQAITIELSYDNNFRAPNFIRTRDTDILLPLFEGQELYARQFTAANQDVSILIEPRGTGR